MSEINKISIAMIGCGKMGGGTIKYLSTSPYVDEVYAYDINQDLLAEKQKELGFKAARTLEEILDNPKIKLVFIATPNSTHVPLAVKALYAGKAVMVEKPVGLSVEEMNKLIKAQKETGGFVQVGLELRYSKCYLYIKNEIDNGTIGKPVNYHFTYSQGPYRASAWRVKKEFSGSMYHEKLCHYIDVVRWWNGSRVNKFVVTSAPNVIPHFEIEDNVHVSYSFENGAVSQLFFLMTATAGHNNDLISNDDLSAQDRLGYKLNYVITGTKGSIELDVFQREIRVYTHCGNSEFKGETAAMIKRYSWPEEEDHLHFHNTKEQNYDIVKRVACGEPPALDLEDAAETMRLCLEFSKAQEKSLWQVIER